MPKISVYLPDDLYRAARAAGLPLSALAQEAVRQALRVAEVDRWVQQVRGRPNRVHTRLDTIGAVHAAREEFGG